MPDRHIICLTLAHAVLDYDDAVQRHAEHATAGAGQWVDSAELDNLYAAMLRAARAVDTPGEVS